MIVGGCEPVRQIEAFAQDDAVRCESDLVEFLDAQFAEGVELPHRGYDEDRGPFVHRAQIGLEEVASHGGVRLV